MKNRAKCKLCGDILESFHLHDYIMCKCGEISIDGGQTAFKCGAKNWSNFLRLNDDGKEISIKVEEKNSEVSEEVNESNKPTKSELINMLKEMIASIENMPSHAMIAPITHYDFSSLLILLLAFLSDDCKSDN